MKNHFFLVNSQNMPIFALGMQARSLKAQMAELVDASVSKTDDREVVPVRSRLRVLWSYYKNPYNLIDCKGFLFDE